nr:MAG TPA: hypothetical protein [Caudoviricetes sp.]
MISGCLLLCIFILCFDGGRVVIRRKLHRHPQCLLNAFFFSFLFKFFLFEL